MKYSYVAAIILLVKSPGESWGLNAIAFASCLCVGKDPTYMVYDEKRVYHDLKDRFWRMDLEKYAESSSTIRSPQTLCEIKPFEKLA